MPGGWRVGFDRLRGAGILGRMWRVYLLVVVSGVCAGGCGSDALTEVPLAASVKAALSDPTGLPRATTPTGAVMATAAASGADGLGAATGPGATSASAAPIGPGDTTGAVDAGSHVGAPALPPAAGGRSAPDVDAIGGAVDRPAADTAPTRRAQPAVDRGSATKPPTTIAAVTAPTAPQAALGARPHAKIAGDNAAAAQSAQASPSAPCTEPAASQRAAQRDR